MAHPVTQQDFQEWKEHLVTKAFFQALTNNREELKESLVRGVYAGTEQEVQGRCAVVLNILNMTYEDLIEGLQVEKY